GLVPLQLFVADEAALEAPAGRVGRAVDVELVGPDQVPAAGVGAARVGGRLPPGPGARAAGADRSARAGAPAGAPGRARAAGPFAVGAAGPAGVRAAGAVTVGARATGAARDRHRDRQKAA